MPSGPADTAAVENATHSYMGRLVPLTRAVYLDESKHAMTLANGLEFPDWREATATIVVRHRNGQPVRVALSASLDRAPWRELHALTVKRVGQDTNGGVVALQNLTGDQSFDLWVGGLVADKAKPLDTVEAVFHVPAGMLTEPWQHVYEQGVDYAEKTSWRLGMAAVTYFKELGDDIGRPDARKRRQQIQHRSAAQFWTDVESEVRLLFAGVEQAVASWGETDWGRAVRRAARQALAAACPHDSSRQMRAYALALQTLTRLSHNESAAKTEEDTDHD
jgi:CRISPR system Cascade subunit CasA